jgi:TP901-1 family phage major tail protein
MATNNIHNGTLMLFKYGTDHSTNNAIAFSTSATLSISMDTRDISNKGSSGFRELLEAQMSWSVSVEGLYATKDANGSAVNNYNDLLNMLKTRTAVYVELGNGVSGDTYYHGQAFITSLEQTSPMEDNMTFSATFEGTGQLSDDVQA